MDPLKASIVQAGPTPRVEARAYDNLVAHGRLSSSEADAWKVALARYLPPPPAKVLEVGAGTGVMSLLIAELGYPITAIDISRAMLQEGRRKAGHRQLMISFEIADGEVLPFHDGEFDAVFGRHIFWTLPHPHRALAEWRRVLRPAGQLVLIDSLAMPRTVANRLRRRISNLLLRLRKPPAAGSGHRYPVSVTSLLPLAGSSDPRRYTNLIGEAGFALTTVETLDALKAMELEAMPLSERWHAQDRKFIFVARRA